jgi:hypothetical protein
MSNTNIYVLRLEGHYSPDCYARTHAKCYTLDSDCESDDDSD